MISLIDRKMIKKDTKKKKRTDIQTDVLRFVDLKGPVSSQQIEQHHNEYARSTIQDKITKLRETEQIKSVPQEQWREYGIYDTDKRHVYYIAEHVSKIREHLDTITETIPHTKDEEELLLILIELKHYDEYVLTTKQLDTLVPLLNYNPTLCAETLQLLLSHKENESREPTNTKKLLASLRKLLKKYKAGDLSDENPRRYALALIQYYTDEYVLEQLKTDLESLKSIESIKNKYGNRYLGRIIRDYGPELFTLQRELIQQGHKDQAQLVSELRSHVKRLYKEQKELTDKRAKEKQEKEDKEAKEEKDKKRTINVKVVDK
jgi:hypothetical protein